MEFDELLERLRFEYWATIAATCQDNHAPHIVKPDMSFYDFLMSKGLSRFQLSARGIGRDIQA